jgi:hypothetical protein
LFDVAAITVAAGIAAPLGRRWGHDGQLPKQWLLRPISIAAASWLRVVDGFAKTAETALHFVGACSRSPAHPVNMKASNRTMILISGNLCQFCRSVWF